MDGESRLVDRSTSQRPADAVSVDNDSDGNAKPWRSTLPPVSSGSFLSFVKSNYPVNFTSWAFLAFPFLVGSGKIGY